MVVIRKTIANKQKQIVFEAISNFKTYIRIPFNVFFKFVFIQIMFNSEFHFETIERNMHPKKKKLLGEKTFKFKFKSDQFRFSILLSLCLVVRSKCSVRAQHRYINNVQLFRTFFSSIWSAHTDCVYLSCFMFHVPCCCAHQLYANIQNIAFT